MEIPRKNFNQKIETNNGTAIISIPENASVDDLLYVKEMLDLVIKRHFHIELNWHQNKILGTTLEEHFIPINWHLTYQLKWKQVNYEKWEKKSWSEEMYCYPGR